MAFTVQEYDGYSRFPNEVIHRPVEIPDGQWVALASSGASWCYPDDPEDHNLCEDTSRNYRTVGHEPTRKIVLDRSRSGRTSSGSRWSYVALVGDQPFGVIFEEKEAGERRGGLYFLCARQVHKGEHGRRPKIARPQFARETPATDLPERNFEGKPISRRDRRRGKKNGWCCLVDLAGFVSMKPHEVVLRYFAFTHAESPRLDVVIASKRAEIHCQKVSHDRILRFAEPMAETKSVMDLFRHHNVDHVWVRQGWALTVLYLHHFGYIPSLPGEVNPPTWRPVTTPVTS